MMKGILTYSFVLISLLGWTNFQDGNELYEQGDFKGAIEQYNLEISDGSRSEALYYNLGNAYYKNGEIGKSIWAYESALKINPGDDDALFNLEYVNAQTADKIDTARHGFGHWLSATLLSYCVNLWAYASIVCSVFFGLFVILFIRSTTKGKKNLSLLGSAIFGFLLILSTILAKMHQGMIIDQSDAVVIVKQLDIKVSPQEDAKTSFIISEGAKVQVIGKDKEWIQIDLNGNQGWVSNESIWKI
ncbi:MAG: tetratricopeptide repeat protein [Crocinitomicaceae bacterium]